MKAIAAESANTITIVALKLNAEMSRSLLNYVGPTLPGMNVTRPS
jgi:hypothetical protein